MGIVPTSRIIADSGNQQISVCISILEDTQKAEVLHNYAMLLYEFHILAKEVDSNPQAKEKFKQQILDVIDASIKIQQAQTSPNQNIFSKLLNWIGDGVKKAWNGVKNTIQKIGEAVKKPFTKNKEIKDAQPALISQPFKQQEDKNEPQKIEEQKELISPPKEAEKNQNSTPKPAEVAVPIVYKNPFQDLYDFFPKDGVAQKCIKTKLGNKFIAFYNGASIPTNENSNSIEDCFDSMKNFFVLAPLSVQQCIKDAFGSDFEIEKALNDPNYHETPEIEKKYKWDCRQFHKFH